MLIEVRINRDRQHPAYFDIAPTPLVLMLLGLLMALLVLRVGTYLSPHEKHPHMM